MFSRVGNSVAFASIYASNNRLYPPYLLSTTFGIANFVSHVLTVPAPLISELEDPIPMLVFLATTLSGGVASLFLTEINTEYRESLRSSESKIADGSDMKDEHTDYFNN